MKLFTKIALGVAGFFAGMALICAVIAFSMGFTLNDFREMVYDGKFMLKINDGLNIHLSDEDDYYEEAENGNDSTHHGDVHHFDSNQKQFDIAHACTKIFVEYGAGNFEIYYGDVSNVQVIQEDVIGFGLTTSEGDQSIYIEGGIDVIDNSDASLIIILPKGVQMEVVDLEIGASQANIRDLLVDELSLVVGAGQADISDIYADEFYLEVGAGQAVVKNLTVSNLDVEAGVGEVDVEIAGMESDYNYSVECGIGQVIVGNRSFGGVGAEQNIANHGAQHHMDIECGIGKVHMRFTGCNVDDGICEEESHNHHGGNHE